MEEREVTLVEGDGGVLQQPKQFSHNDGSNVVSSVELVCRLLPGLRRPCLLSLRLSVLRGERKATIYKTVSASAPI